MTPTTRGSDPKPNLQMPKILPPPVPDTPDYEPGMKVSVMPSGHCLWLDDYEYWDQLGRDPFQERKIWGISDPEERANQAKEALQEYPKQRHRRRLLCKAAKRGDEEVIRVILESDLRVQPDIEKWKQVEREKTRKKEAGEEEEDDEGAGDDGSIPDTDDPVDVPLHIAAANGQLACTRILIEEGGAEVDARDEEDYTPLIYAARSNHAHVVQYLLGAGADPTAKTAEGTTALEYAAMHGNIEAIKMLLEHPFYGSTRKRKSREDKEQGVWITPAVIKAGARSGNSEALKLLLERGAFPMEDVDGKWKAELLDEEQKQTIIDSTPPAVEYGDLESLKLILSYQYPSVEAFDVPEAWHKSWTYGAYHAVATDKPSKLTYLHSFGVKQHDTMSLDKLPSDQTVNIQHLFDKACEKGSVSCAELLIEKFGAEPDKHRIPAGIEPIYAAAGNDQTKTVKYLLENHEIDLHVGNGRYSAGPTALWIAIQLKSYDSIALLLQHGGPVDHIDSSILNISGPINAILRAKPATRGSRPSVSFEAQDSESAKKYIYSAQSDFQNMNPAYVRVALSLEDKPWISGLQIRKSGEELREEGPKAREWDEKERVKRKDLAEDDPRRMMPPCPTFAGREAKLKSNDDLIPEFKPFMVPVGRAGDDDD